MKTTLQYKFHRTANLTLKLIGETKKSYTTSILLKSRRENVAAK